MEVSQFIDGIKLWIFLYITTLSISRITIASQVFWIFYFSVDVSFSERFPEKCSTFHSHVGHNKEKFECSFHSRKYWSRVTWIDCNIIGIFRGLHDSICFRLRYVRLSSYRTRQILNLSTGDSVSERVIQVVEDELSFHVPSHPMLTVVSLLTALKNYQINSCERLALKCCI